MGNRTFRLKQTFADLITLSVRMRRKPAKVEYQMVFLLPDNVSVLGLWERTSIVCTQRTILAFAAKMHSQYKIITLCIKAPDGNITREVYYWCKGEITTNWGNVPTR